MTTSSFSAHGGQRQEQVATRLDGGRDEAVGCHANSRFLQRLVPTGRLGAARGRQAAFVDCDPAHADAVRLARRQRVEHAVGLRVADVVAVQRILVVADGLALSSSDSGSQPMRCCGRAASSARCRRPCRCRAWSASPPRLRQPPAPPRRPRAPGAGSISAMIWPPGTSMLPVMAISASTQWPAWLPFWFWSNARPQAMDGRLGGGVQARRPVDVLHRHLADLGGLLGRHALLRVVDALGELVEAVRTTSPRSRGRTGPR